MMYYLQHYRRSEIDSPSAVFCRCVTLFSYVRALYPDISRGRGTSRVVHIGRQTGIRGKRRKVLSADPGPEGSEWRLDKYEFCGDVFFSLIGSSRIIANTHLIPHPRESCAQYWLK